MRLSSNTPHFLALVPALLWLVASGCSNDYAFTVNDQPVYHPPSLLSDFELDDPALHTCVQQTIEDQRITEAGALRRLNCSSAGIESLEGLERFSGLAFVQLSDNAIRDLSPLKKLSRLEILLLEDNRLESAAPLLSLLRLEQLDLRENPSLACADARQLAANLEGEVRLPAHCRERSDSDA